VTTSGPVLETERLVLRVSGSGEAELYLDYYRRNRSHLEPWDPPRPDDFYTLPWWRRQLADNQRELQSDRSMRLGMFLRSGEQEGTLVGIANFTNIIRGPFQACFLGYNVDGSREGQGYMFEGLGAAVDHALGPLRLNRVMANYQPSNERSGRLLKRLGFVQEGLAPRYLFIAGAWRDHVLTSKTADPPIPR